MSKKRILSVLLALILCSSTLSAIGLPPALTAAAEDTALPTSASFVDGTMDDQWTVLRPLTEGDLAYGLEKGRGLKLRTQELGMQQTPYNVFTRPAGGDSWEAVAKIYYPVAPNQNYQQITFGVYQDDNNYMKLNIEYNTVSRMAQFSINRNGVYAHTHQTRLNNSIFPAEVQANRANNLYAYYKITKTGDLYKASVSFNGVDYVTVGSKNGGTVTNGEYTATYADPKIFVAAIKDYATTNVIDSYCEFVKVYNINGGPSTDVLAEAFQDVKTYVTTDIAVIPETLELATDIDYDGLSYANLPPVPYGYSYKLTPGSSDLSIDNDTGVVTPAVAGETTLKLELVQGSKVELLKTYTVVTAQRYDPVTVQFHYNYTGAPAAPASFTKQTKINGKLTEFPVEQTLPLVGSRSDYGFVGWYTNPEGTGEKVTLDTVFPDNTSLYAKWEQVPSLAGEYEDYFLMGAFQDFSTSNAQMLKHYNINCPSNNFKLNSQINTTTMRNNFTAARTQILADNSLTDAEKDEALARANEKVALNANPTVMTMLNNMRAWNQAHPDDKKYTRFHVIAWHGGQQPNQFFTNGFQYTNDNTSIARTQNLRDPNQDGAVASRETMKARLDDYIRQVMTRYAAYKDIIVSWDVINEPVDDFTGQIRNAVGDSRSQRGQWGLVWHDGHPARNEDGSIKYTSVADEFDGVIYDSQRLYDESEWMRWATESAAKWATELDCDWPLYVNDYMDSNKLYTKLEPTLDIMQSLRDDVDLQGQKLVYGLQGRLAWAYPTIPTLRKQVEDALKLVDMVGVTEADIRSDFEPNPFYDPSKPPQAVSLMGYNPTPKWTSGDLDSGSGSFTNPTPGTLTNTFDTHNSPVRRIPEWGTGNGMSAASASARYEAPNGFLPISEMVMKKQADFAADWMDILIDNYEKVELFQWDGYTDANTFNSNKGAHLWVNGIPGRSGTFEKYSFFATIGAPARDKMEKAISATPDLSDADKFSGNPTAWANFVKALDTATSLVDKRIYTLEGVNDVKDATAALYAAADALEETSTLLIYDANGGANPRVSEGYASAASATVKTADAVGFTRDGYAFSGWNTKANGTGTAYAAGATIPMDAHVTLYAQWDSHSVMFRLYSGKADLPTVQVAPGERVAKPADPTRDGYFFGGWYKDLALTKPYNFNSPVTENLRLYAKWDLSAHVEFYYNYTGAPATRPDSFSQMTNDEGILVDFPVEQTLPQVGSRPDYGFVGWYTNPEGTGEKVTPDTVFTENTELYAQWEQVPSLAGEYEDYFLMGAFADFNSNSAQMTKHYNINCPSNSFKLNSQINPTAMRNNFVAARNQILADDSLSEIEKTEALARANEEVVLATNPTVINMLNNIRNWNATHPDPKDKKYTRFHVIAWHGGQQPNQFFTNAFQYTNDNTSLARSQNLRDTNQDGAVASRETMKARLDNYIKQVMARYAPYKDIIVSWDVINEPVDDFTGQIRNAVGDSRSQRGQWGLVWHDGHPALNADGSVKYTSVVDEMGIITDPDRLFDESEWMRWACESSAKWATEYECDWPLYINDYMDSNKLYTKLQPTLDIIKDIRDTVDLKGQKLVYGLQGRLAWAYPTIPTLRKQVEDALDIADMVGVTEADIRSDFEPNPHYDPTKPPQPVSLMGMNPEHKWTAGDTNSGSGSFTNPTPGTLTNTFDTDNSPVRRIPEWGTGNGMAASSERYGANGYLAISEQIMKKQADFAADWMDILIDHYEKVELFQWDGTTDSATFNGSKGAHMWVSTPVGRSAGTYEKYSFFAVIGAPARDKMEKAISANPTLDDAAKFSGNPTAWAAYAKALNAATALVDKRIYTLEGVNDVKNATAALEAAAEALEESNVLLIYDANGGSGSRVSEGYASGANATAKTATALGFAKDGYTFDGWNTLANGTGTAYAAGATIAMNAHVALFAQWKAVPTDFTVAFESYNIGTGTTLNNPLIPPVKVAGGGKVSKPADPVKPGCYFEGWYRDMALTDPWDFANDTVTSNIRLYARWASLSFTYAGQAATTAIVPGETLTVRAHLLPSSTNRTMIASLYNAKGVLIKAVNSNGVTADGKATFNVDLAIPADIGSGAYVQVFVWNTNTGMPIYQKTIFSGEGVK